MKTWSSGDPTRSRYRHDVNKAHMVHMVMRRTSMVQVQTIHGVIIADMVMKTFLSGDPICSDTDMM